MLETGKILFYNPNEGTGIIITEGKSKYNFAIMDWDDFEAVPKVGLLVAFELLELEAVKVVVRHEVSTPKEDNSSDKSVASSCEPKEERPIFSDFASRPLTIALECDVDKSIKEYFQSIEEDIHKRVRYQSSSGRLDFLRIRRFLFTTFNNLSELDPHFITDEIRKVEKDLVEMSQVYDEYKTKTIYPDIAYDRVFLKRQDSYQKIKEESELVFKELQRLHVSEQYLSKTIEEKEEVLKRTLNTSTQSERLHEEFKVIKGEYVDTVHMLAVLDNQLQADKKLLHEFEEKYAKEFLSKFSLMSKKYRKQILYILDAQAFLFDSQLWAQAKQSKILQRFFQESHIKGEYCARTYLKYYLNSLDEEKVSEETKELFALYDYLLTLEHDTAAILVHDIDDALRLKYIFSQLDLPILVEAFVDEKKAMRWAFNNHANILIVEDELQNVDGLSFIQTYKKVSLQTKTILLTNTTTTSDTQEVIDKIMPKGFSNSEMSLVIKEFLQKDNDGQSNTDATTPTTT